MLRARPHAAATRWDLASRTAFANDSNGRFTSRHMDIPVEEGGDEVAVFAFAVGVDAPPIPPPRGKVDIVIARARVVADE
jgi:hypothetical protein